MRIEAENCGCEAADRCWCMILHHGNKQHEDDQKTVNNSSVYPLRDRNSELFQFPSVFCNLAFSGGWLVRRHCSVKCKREID